MVRVYFNFYIYLVIINMHFCTLKLNITCGVGGKVAAAV